MVEGSCFAQVSLIRTKPALKGVEASLARRRGKNVLKLVLPSGGNMVEIVRLLEQARADTSTPRGRVEAPRPA